MGSGTLNTQPLVPPPTDQEPNSQTPPLSDAGVRGPQPTIPRIQKSSSPDPFLPGSRSPEPQHPLPSIKESRLPDPSSPSPTGSSSPPSPHSDPGILTPNRLACQIQESRPVAFPPQDARVRTPVPTRVISQRSCRNCNPRQSSAQKTALMQPQCLLGFVVFPKATHPSLCSSSISLRLRAPRASKLPTSLTSRLSRSQNYLSHQASRPQHPGLCRYAFWEL